MTFEHLVLVRTRLKKEDVESEWWVSPDGEELCPDSKLEIGLNAAGKEGFQLVSALKDRLYLVKAVPVDPEPVKQAPRYFGNGSDSKCGNEFVNPLNDSSYECQREKDHEGNHWSLGLHWTHSGKLVCNEKAPTEPCITRFCEREKDHEEDYSTTLESGKVMTWAKS